MQLWPTAIALILVSLSSCREQPSTHPAKQEDQRSEDTLSAEEWDSKIAQIEKDPDLIIVQGEVGLGEIALVVNIRTEQIAEVLTWKPPEFEAHSSNSLYLIYDLARKATVKTEKEIDELEIKRAEFEAILADNTVPNNHDKKIDARAKLAGLQKRKEQLLSPIDPHPNGVPEHLIFDLDGVDLEE